TLDDNYKITLLRTDTKSQIIVTVLPGEERTFSVSRFTVHIPIEKRFFKLTPEQIEKEIQATNNAIKTLDNVIDKTSKLWNVYTGYCLTYASYLYVKNFFTDKTTVKARKEVIDKWKSYCVDLVKEYEKTYETAKTNSYSSTQDCLNENAKSIEEEVNYAKEIIENVESDPTFKDKPYLREAEVKRRIADNAINKNKDPGLIKKYVDDFLTTEKNANQQGRINFDVDQIKNYLYDKEGKRIENVNFEELFKKYPELQSYKEEINILKDSNTKGFEKEQAINNILEKERLARSYEYNKEFINSEAGYSKYNVNDAVTTFFNKLKQPATTQKDEGQEQIIFDNIAPDKNGNAVYFRDSNPNRPEEIFKDKGLTQKSIYAEINKKDQNQLYYLKGPQEVRVTDIKTQEPFTPKISISDESGTKGRIKAVSIDSLHYIEVTKRGISGEIIKVAVFKSRNENELGTGYRIIDEFDLNDCNKKIEENPIKSALGNAKVNPCEIIKDAESENNRRLSLGGVNERTLHINGKPYALEKFKLEASTLECADINSINECRILFGACDPVMCPPSRFDFDGRWKNIDNVIQSGISGSIVLGLHNYDPPYEPLPVCVTGIRAGLKNIQSIFVGYNECLQRKKLRGEAIGGCSYIRSLGWCQVVWGEATSILGTIGTERIVQLGAKAIGQGGNEYVQNFHENFKRSNEFLSFFTSQYGQNVFAAYRGKGTKEIGSEFCEAAIFGRLPGQGSIIDQLSKPSVPAQFFAVFDESPHVDVDGEQLSNYRILYHVYAGEDHDIRYIISLKRSDTGKEKQVTYSTYLQKGRTDQNTVNVIEDSTYDQICVRIDGSAPKCGFGKVGTEFAISYAQEKLLEKEYAKNANNERECISDSTMIVTNPDIVTTPLSLIASGVKETGARRTCSQENPGKGTISENKWVQRGSCGKDAQGRDLGKCWLDTESLNFQDEKNKQKIKELEELNQRLEELRDNKEIKESLQNLEIKKLTLDSNLKALFSKINALLSNTVQIKNALNTIEQQYLDLANEYLELNKQTIDPIFDGNIYFKVAELYQTLESIKLKIENLEKIAQTIEKAKTLEKGIKECPRSGDSYECGSMADGETAILPGTPISIKVNLRSEQIGTVQKVELEVYTTENNKKKQVDCDFWNLFNKNIIFDRADDITTRKNCGELISIRYQGSDEKFTSVYFTATLLKKGLEISKIEIPPEEKILTTKDIEKAKVTLERLKGFTGVNIEYIKKAVKTYNVDPSWIVAIITVESGGNEKAVSLCGAAGLGQLVVPTAKDELGLYVPDYKMMSTASYTNSRGEKVSCTVTFKNNDPAIPEHCYSEDQDECDYQNDQRFLPEFALPAIAKYLSLLRGDDPNKNYDIYTKGNLDYIFAAYNGGFCNSKNNYGALCDSDNCPGLKSFQCEKDAYYINTKGQTKNYVAYVNAYINHYKNSQEFIDLFKDELLASTQETVPEDTQLAVLLPPEVSIEEDVA
ncbi:transglycosylase SLT domain-containing protein, partial [Candidatus Woesearchaeota archaeon]|nr:transglycosylase SLT domain-containing protein [Candidatus Woesearchaeota archaeon]